MKAGQVAKRVLLRMMHQRTMQAWRGWREVLRHSDRQRGDLVRARRIVSRVLLRMMRQRTMQAWRGWHEALRHSDRQQEDLLRARRIIGRVARRFGCALCSAAWQTWKSAVASSFRRLAKAQLAERACIKLLRRMKHRTLSAAWSSWAASTRRLARAQGDFQRGRVVVVRITRRLESVSRDRMWRRWKEHRERASACIQEHELALAIMWNHLRRLQNYGRVRAWSVWKNTAWRHAKVAQDLHHGNIALAHFVRERGGKRLVRSFLKWKSQTDHAGSVAEARVHAARAIIRIASRLRSRQITRAWSKMNSLTMDWGIRLRAAASVCSLICRSAQFRARRALWMWCVHMQDMRQKDNALLLAITRADRATWSYVRHVKLRNLNVRFQKWHGMVTRNFHLQALLKRAITVSSRCALLTAWRRWSGQRTYALLREGGLECLTKYWYRCRLTAATSLWLWQTAQLRHKDHAIRSTAKALKRKVLLETGRAFKRWTSSIWHHKLSWFKVTSGFHRVLALHDGNARQLQRRRLKQWVMVVSCERRAVLSKTSGATKLAATVQAWARKKTMLALRTWSGAVATASFRRSGLRRAMARLRTVRARWRHHWVWASWNTWRGAVRAAKMAEYIAAWGTSRIWTLARLKCRRVVGNAFVRWRTGTNKQRWRHSQLTGGIRSSRLVLLQWTRRPLSKALRTWVLTTEVQRRWRIERGHWAVRLWQSLRHKSTARVALAFRYWARIVARLGDRDRRILKLARRVGRRTLWTSLWTWVCRTEHLRKQEGLVRVLLRRWFQRKSWLAWSRWRHAVASDRELGRRRRLLYRCAGRWQARTLHTAVAAWRRSAAVGRSKALAHVQARFVSTISHCIQQWQRVTLGRAWVSWRCIVLAGKKLVRLACRAKNLVSNDAFKRWRRTLATHTLRVDGCKRFFRFLVFAGSTRHQRGTARGFCKWAAVTLGAEIDTMRKQHSEGRARGTHRAGMRLASALRLWTRRRLARAWRCMHAIASAKRSKWYATLRLKQTFVTWDKWQLSKAWRRWLWSSNSRSTATSRMRLGLAFLSATEQRRDLVLTARAVRRWGSFVQASQKRAERTSAAFGKCLTLLISREARLLRRGLVRWCIHLVKTRCLQRITARWKHRLQNAGFNALHVAAAGGAKAVAYSKLRVRFEGASVRGVLSRFRSRMLVGAFKKWAGVAVAQDKTESARALAQRRLRVVLFTSWLRAVARAYGAWHRAAIDVARNLEVRAHASTRIFSLFANWSHRTLRGALLTWAKRSSEEVQADERKRRSLNALEAQRQVAWRGWLRASWRRWIVVCAAAKLAEMSKAQVGRLATRMRTFRNRVAYGILSRLGSRKADAVVKAAWAELSERSFLRSRKRFERALLQGRLVRKIEPRQLRHSWVIWLRRSRRVRSTFAAWRSLGQRAGRFGALFRARANVMRLARTRSAFGRWSVDTRVHSVARRQCGLYICLQKLAVRRRTTQLRMMVHGVSTWRTFCQHELTKGRGLQAGAMARGALALCHLLHLERLSLSKSWLRWRAMAAIKIKMQAVAVHRFRLLLPRSRHRIMVSIDVLARFVSPAPTLATVPTSFHHDRHVVCASGHFVRGSKRSVDVACGDLYFQPGEPSLARRPSSELLPNRSCATFSPAPLSE